MFFFHNIKNNKIMLQNIHEKAGREEGVIIQTKLPKTKIGIIFLKDSHEVRFLPHP